jgi:putative restriction endonuclease
MDIDSAIRIEAFNWLNKQKNILGDVLSRKLLEQGFIFKDMRIPLVSPQGIFKPKIMDIPLSITTAPKGPYDDSFSEDGFLVYRYRGNNPDHRDNVGLRRAFQKNRPLIYFHGIVPGRYLAVYPVYITGDDPKNLSFKVAVDEMQNVDINQNLPADLDENEGRRAYLTATIKQRLHQRGFREKVLDAYRTSCAFCKLRHRELLDAAHIIPDNEPDSKPIVKNGMALCKLHHAAYDSFIIGITPDYSIKVRQDILQEEDGPILKYGLKELHNSTLILPSSKKHWPGREYLEWRYERFRKVA